MQLAARVPSAHPDPRAPAHPQGGYGSGAIMAVPGHDTRDLEFAHAFGLPVRTVVAAAAGGETAAAAEPAASSSGSGGNGAAPAEAFTAPGVAVNSSCSTSGLQLDGLATPEAKAAAIAWLEQKGLGHRQVGGRGSWCGCRRGVPLPPLPLAAAAAARWQYQPHW